VLGLKVCTTTPGILKIWWESHLNL
jgi:hypothetical protein